MATTTRPSALPALLNELLDQRGWGLRDLQRETARLAEDDDTGVAIATISHLMNGQGVIPRIPRLWLLAGALGQPPARLLLALGYDPGRASWDGIERREPLVGQVRAASEAQARQLQRVLALPPDQWAALDAFLDALEAQRS